MNHPLLAALIIAATLVVDVITDLKRWGRINHIRGTWLRVPSALIAAIIHPWSLILWVAYMAVFNLALNIGRGLPWDYVGQTAWSDKVIRCNPWLQWVGWIAGIMSIIIYIVL